MKLHQHFTPTWAAGALLEQFVCMDRSEVVLEPSCGDGAFLSAIPRDVTAYGVELDPVIAERARVVTGRPVITGDFRTIPLPGIEPTLLVGNPPFSASVIDRFLARAHDLLPNGGRVAFILPAYYFQTAMSVERMRERWSIAQDLLPRNLFHRLSLPIVFARFTKDRRRTLIGFALYAETTDWRALSEEYRDALRAPGSVWRNTVVVALRRLGGRATLPALYSEIENYRPTRSQWWREKIRQTLRTYSDFRALDVGEYCLT